MSEEKAVIVGCRHTKEVGGPADPNRGQYEDGKAQTGSTPGNPAKDTINKPATAQSITFPDISDLSEIMEEFDKIDPKAEMLLDKLSNLPRTKGEVKILKKVDKKLEEESVFSEVYTNRYEKWLEHKKTLEGEIRKFEAHKEKFLLRWSGKTRDRPTTDEIRQYENDKAINDMKCRELTVVENKVKQSFDLTTLPKTVDDGMSILKRMAPSHAIFIKPKELRDALALSAPGGVVDEIEVNKDVEMIKERMMKAKRKALEDIKLKQPQESVVQEGKKGRKRKNQGKKQVNGKVDDNKDIMDSMESKNANEESNDAEEPWDKLWYCTLIFPQLAQELVDVSKDLETNLGAAGALVALNTALMEESLELDKMCDVIDSKHVDKDIGGGVRLTTPKPTQPLYALMSSLDGVGVRLGNVAATIRLVTYYREYLKEPKKAIKLLNFAIEAGFADVLVYKTLGDVYFHGPEINWAEAEKYYRIASEFQPSKAGESEIIAEAQIGRIRIYAVGGPGIPADPVYAAYLMSKLYTTRKDAEPLTLARMYRFGFWRYCPSYSESCRYYKLVLNTEHRWVTKPVIKDMVEFVNMVAKGARCTKKERETRLNYLLTCIKLHPGIPDVYSYIADHYMTESVVYDSGMDLNVAMKLIKDYLDEGLRYVSPDDPSSGARLLCSFIKYYRYVGDPKILQEYLTQVEAKVHFVPVDIRMNINLLVGNVYQDDFKDYAMSMERLDRLINDGDLECLATKGINLSQSDDPDIQRAAFLCNLEANKYLSRDHTSIPKLLGLNYYHLGRVYLGLDYPHDDDEEDEEGEEGEEDEEGEEGENGEGKADTIIPPIDRALARSCFQKALANGVNKAWHGLAETYFSELRPWESGKDDKTQAVRCYTKAVELDPRDCEALFELAYLYLKGWGVKQDIKKAQEYYRKSIANASPDFIEYISQYDSEFGGGFKSINKRGKYKGKR